MVLGDGLFKGGWVFIFQKVSKREERERLRSTSNASSENLFDWRFPKCPLPLGTSNVFLFLISRKLSGETKWGSKGNSMRDCLRSVKQSSHRRVSITHTHTLTLYGNGTEHRLFRDLESHFHIHLTSMLRLTLRSSLLSSLPLYVLPLGKSLHCYVL